MDEMKRERTMTRGLGEMRCPDALGKAAAVAPDLLASGLCLVITWPVLSPVAQLCLAGAVGAVSGLSQNGFGESAAIRVLFGARRLDDADHPGFRHTVTELHGAGMSQPVIRMYVTARRGSAPVRAVGRRSLILSRDFVLAVNSNLVPRHEAAGVLAHGVAVIGSGMNRQDVLIRILSLPWLTLRRAARPMSGLLASAWKVRFLVFGVAMWRSVTESSSAANSGSGFATGCALATLLGLTYAGPIFARTWHQHVIRQADRSVTAQDLGPSLASFLRRQPATPFTVSRVQALAPQNPEAARLQHVPSWGQSGHAVHQVPEEGIHD
jgi:hypothetical protein